MTATTTGAATEVETRAFFARPGDRLGANWPAISTARWLLPAVLVVQTLLSARLIWSNTAFQDEALYLYAGHDEWSHWVYGAALPKLAGFFSGAPVVYPPVAAWADAFAGLAGARLLSLCFMLVASTALHGVTRRVYGRRAAFFAVALFAGLGSVQFVGALATYDAMAMMLLAVGTWLGVRAAEARSLPQAGLLLLSAAAICAADAAKYSAVLLDPVAIGVVVLLIWSRSGRDAACRAAALLCIPLAAGLFAALELGGSAYWHGITSTTLARPSGATSPFVILYLSAGWDGLLMALAVIGALFVFCTRRDRPTRVLALSFALAPFFAPMSQARMGVLTSLFKHVAFGSWFGAIIAGLALASLPRAVPTVKRRAAECVSLAALVLCAVPGISLATGHYSHGWPNTTSYIQALRPIVANADGPVLLDEPSIAEYYLPRLVTWQNALNTDVFTYRVPRSGRPLTGAPALAAAIQAGYPAVIALVSGDTENRDDSAILDDIERFHTYKLAVGVPYRLWGNTHHFLIFTRNFGG